MSLYVAGISRFGELGVKPTSRINGEKIYVPSLTRVPLNLEDIQCISTGGLHTVIIKAGNVFATGVESCIFGSNNHFSKKEFSLLNIFEGPISWAACGFDFTLYLTTSGKVILCHGYKFFNGYRINIELDKRAVGVFAGCNRGGIIEEDGTFQILDLEEGYSKPIRYYLGISPIDMVICKTFICILASDRKVWGNSHLNKNNIKSFTEVASLNGIEIVKLCGMSKTCAALTSDGRVFFCGDNSGGEFGNGTTRSNFNSFVEVNFLEPVKDISCYCNTLILTKSNKILGCGTSEYNKLLFKSDKPTISVPVQIASMEADHVISMLDNFFVLSGTGKLENPAKKYFLSKQKVSIETELTSENENQMNDEDKIDYISSLCQSQAQSINQLAEMCISLQRQNETIKKEVMDACSLNMRAMSEIQEEIRQQNLLIQELHEKNDGTNSFCE